ncbi:alkaline phosphatase D family protein [Rhodococcus sp. NPDC058521]|uniref:alkaline phosphatase D family protein n=1 Tax=Rhodococcus sp. NPDC058521 TaxID=3346536 RepID=UPI003653775D
MSSSSLIIGPLLRYTDETSAVIWVEVAARSTVAVHIGDRAWHAATFCAHGHHYALVDVDGLKPGSSYEYTLTVDDLEVWPPASGDGADYPPSVIRTPDPSRGLRFAFGSCRTSVSHDEVSNKTHGVDVLRAFALRMMDGDDHPDFVLFLGDQVYADETSAAMQSFIASRRNLDEPPGVELQGFEEYAHLYSLSWNDPANRWLLATLPSAMIFDDHDVRDDWNTSHTWRRQMEATGWWKDRIIGALGSYWIYQHLGNLSPSDRAEDEMWQYVLELRARGKDDITDRLDAFADRADDQPDSYRWSFARDLGASRLIVIDSRAARVLRPDARRMLDQNETDWLDARMHGDVDHLFVGTSLPYLLPNGLHAFEAWNEAVAEGVWGRRAGRVGEKIRQGFDLEHWAAFQNSFRLLADVIMEVADGKRGKPPSSVTFLSGDVHHSYLAQVDREEGGSTILQAVCSPIRNPLPRWIRAGQSLTSKKPVVAIGRALARSAKVPKPPFEWRLTAGPWFDNMLGMVEVNGPRLDISWSTAHQDHTGTTVGVEHVSTLADRATCASSAE